MTTGYIYIQQNTSQWLGSNPQSGDWISHLVIIPQTKKVGKVVLSDGAIDIITYQGGILTGDLTPIYIPLEIHCKNAGFKLTVNDGVNVIAVGDFK